MGNLSISTSASKEPSPMPRYSVSFLTPAEVEQSPGVLAAWKDLLDHSTNLNRLYQSPEWWNHLCSMRNGLQTFLGVVRDSSDAVVGVVPLQIGPRELPFEFINRTFWQMRFDTVFILGSQPLLPDDESAYQHLFRSLWDSFSRCSSIYMKSVFKESRCWRHFEPANSLSEKNWFFYSEDVRRFHSIRVPATFEEYMKKFSSKGRHTLRRNMKNLQQRGGGDMQLERIENTEQVDRFLGIARPIFDRSWKGKRRFTSHIEGGMPRFEDLARRGILRSYLLRCGDDYCAYHIGYQFRGVYYSIEPAYDPAFAEYSPGQVALLLIIEDLIKHDPPEILSFGHGDQRYKAHFGTDHTEDTSIVLMKKTLANRFKCGCHQTFQFSTQAIKRCLGRS